MPKTCPYRFEQQIHLGNIDYTFADLDRRIIEPLKKRFISNYLNLKQVTRTIFLTITATTLPWRWLKVWG
jgi:hypothetical protein